jgi:hypothetical protein
MKLIDYTGWLVSTVQDDQTTVTELLRALREQSSHFDPKKAPADTLLGPDILRAKSGPGGGLDADPFLASFALLAVMLGGKRADVGERVWRSWHMHHEGSVLAGWGKDFRGKLVRCKMTGQVLFGNAVQAALANEEWTRSIDKLRVSGDHFGEIV